MNLWLINLDLQEFVCDNGLIKPNQYAYAKNLSTTVALIMLVDSWILAIDKGEKVVCAFLDLRNALDTINHKVLLNKLMKYGVKDDSMIGLPTISQVDLSLFLIRMCNPITEV